MSDIFREVEEELRHEQYKKVWDKYGPFVVGLAVLIVVGTAGYRGWEAWQASLARDAGDKYIAALDTADGGDAEAAETELKTLSSEAPSGYAALARMRAAALLAQNDNVDGAIAAYDEIIADRSVGQPLRDAARIRAGYLLVDGDDMAKVTDKVESLAVADQPWRHSARELLGLASYKAGKLNDAETWFRQIIDDREAPAVVSERARLMLDLIRSQGVGAAPAPETGSNENSAGNSAEGQQ